MSWQPTMHPHTFPRTTFCQYSIKCQVIKNQYTLLLVKFFLSIFIVFNTACEFKMGTDVEKPPSVAMPPTATPQDTTVNNSAYQRGLEAYQRKDYTTALSYWENSAAAGDLEAQVHIGWMYEYGQGVLQNHTIAAKWYLKAAEAGHASAQTNLGVMYQYGDGLEQSLDNAIHWYRQAAEAGDPNANYNLGMIYESGNGVPRNITQAINWYTKAAEVGHVNSQTKLAGIYRRGAALPQDLQKALYWYKQGAEQTHITTTNRLPQKLTDTHDP